MIRQYLNKRKKKVIIKEMHDSYLLSAFDFFKRNIRKLYVLRAALYKFRSFKIVQKFIKVVDEDIVRVKKVVKALNTEKVRRFE